jgi:predicted dehydrogenase
LDTIRFGIIGLGLMGREFASAAARWCHLAEMEIRPEIVAICSKHLYPQMVDWCIQHFPTVTQVTNDYRELINNPVVDAVYCAVPNHLHAEIYSTVIESGKHLMGEKPFGIDKQANEVILSTIKEHPESFIRCSSQFAFFPAVQKIGNMIEAKAFGQIIEVEAGFLHSGDLNPDKPINWKRMVEFNGEYGCMGDLGMHICFVPFRAEWIPRNVRAILSNIIQERPDGKGVRVPCETWDNATLFCEAIDKQSGDTFPMTIKTQRIAPGETNTWYLSILGTKGAAKFSTKYPKALHILEYTGSEQAWQTIEMGQETAFKTITGRIFEFGFSDSLLQMWAAYLYELKHKHPLSRFAGCVTPEETALSHQLFTAALDSQKTQSVVSLEG